MLLLSMYSSRHLVEGSQLMWGVVCGVEYKGVYCMLVSHFIGFLNDCWLLFNSNMLCGSIGLLCFLAHLEN